MRIDYKILKKLLECNKNIKLKFIENTNYLEIIINSKPIAKLELSNDIIEENSEVIYNTIVNLENITLYIPSIYQ